MICIDTNTYATRITPTRHNDALCVPPIPHTLRVHTDTLIHSHRVVVAALALALALAPASSIALKKQKEKKQNQHETLSIEIS